MNHYKPSDFLCIGAQKAGTTWLDRQLRRIPEIWLPATKELHYFDELELSSVPTILERLKGAEPHNRRWRRKFLRDIRCELSCFNAKGLYWTVKYLFLQRSDEWYLSLFKPGADRISGEITPNYSALPPHRVAHVHRLLPDVKIIFLMRDPIDRSWSHAKMELGLRKNRSIKEVSFSELVTFFTDSGATWKHAELGNYLRTINTWESFYPPDQIFYGFLDDIAEQPSEIFQSICQFLNVPGESAMDSKLLHQNVHVGEQSEIPEDVAAFLAELHIESLVELERRFGHPVTKWRIRAEALISRIPDHE